MGSRRSPPIDPDDSARGSRGNGGGQLRAAAELDPGLRPGSKRPTPRASRGRSRSCCRPGEGSSEWQAKREGGIGGRGRASPAHPAAAAQMAVSPLRRAPRADDRRRRGRGGRSAARAQARPQPPGHARRSGFAKSRPISAARPRSTKRSPRPSRRPADTPSGNTPGSRTSPRRMAALSEALDIDRRRLALLNPLASARGRRQSLTGSGRTDYGILAIPTSIPRRSPASASQSSVTAIRAAPRHSTFTTAAIDVVVGLREESGSADEAEAAGLKIALIEDAVGRADVVMLLAPDEITALCTRRSNLICAKVPRSASAMASRCASAWSNREPTSTCSCSRPKDPARRFAPSIGRARE